MPVVLKVKYGNAIQIGDGPDRGAVVAVDYAAGSQVKLTLATSLPITHLPDGIFPPRFVTGLHGEPERVQRPALARAG